MQTPLCSCLLQVHQSLKSLQGYDASKECPPAKWQSGSSATCWHFEAVVSWLAVLASFASMHKSVTVIFSASPILKRERERVSVWVNCKVCGVCMFICGDEHVGVLFSNRHTQPAQATSGWIRWSSKEKYVQSSTSMCDMAAFGKKVVYNLLHYCDFAGWVRKVIYNLLLWHCWLGEESGLLSSSLWHCGLSEETDLH